MAIEKPLVSGPFPEETEEVVEVDTEQDEDDVSIGVLNPEPFRLKLKTAA